MATDLYDREKEGSNYIFGRQHLFGVQSHCSISYAADRYFNRTFNETYSLLFLLINKIKPIFLTLLFFLLCFSILSTTIQAELHATTVHFVKHILKSKTPLKTDQTLRRESYWVSGIILCCCLSSPIS